mgnify:CR=1 FL=1
MATKFIMPKLGLTMEDGTVSTWLKKEGDVVKKGDPMCEITTEKLTNEIEATTDGVLLKIVVPEGETVDCQATIAIIGEEGEDISELLAE